MDRLSQLHHGALESLLERVFSELSPPGRWDRLERLELDLGTLQASDLEQQLPQRLEAALRGVPFRYDRAADVAATAGDFAGRPLALPLLIVVAALLLLEQLVAYAAGYHPVARRPTA
jgi:hypothetical protein